MLLFIQGLVRSVYKDLAHQNPGSHDFDLNERLVRCLVQYISVLTMQIAIGLCRELCIDYIAIAIIFVQLL